MSTALTWLGIAAGIWIANAVLDDLRFRGGPGDYLIIAAVFGVLDFFFHWLFVAAFAIASLGLALVFRFVTEVVVYAVILKMTSALSSRLEIKSIGTAVAAAFIISCTGTAATWLARMIP